MIIHFNCKYTITISAKKHDKARNKLKRAQAGSSLHLELPNETTDKYK